MLTQRILSGLLFLPIFYLVTWRLHPVYFTALVLVAVVVGQHEFYRMAKARGITPDSVLGMVLGALVVLESYHPVPAGELRYYLAAILLAIMIGRLFSPRPVDGALEDISVTALGVFYVAFLFSFQVAVRMVADGKQWLVFLFFIIWASDIGAYSIGIPFGKHRLYVKVSPKKSVEGFLGALAAAAGMALICRSWFMPSLGVTEAVGIALALAAIGTAGDLVESLIKRAAGVKDSGSIIPGHGGILDRMDSMLFAAPVLYYYLKMR
jgi:phosphatidate cytidylyltransferase